MVDKRNKEEVNKETKEEKKEIDLYERIADRADKEINRVYRIYRLLVPTLGGIVVVGLTLATILIGSSISDLEQRVNKRVDEEFKKENITTLIEEKAKEYTERVAEKFIAAEINEIITPFKEEMRLALEEANAQVQRLNDLFIVSFVADKAKNGSKNAYMDLKNFAAKGRTEVGIVARNKLTEIEKYLDMYRSPPSMYRSLVIKTDSGDVAPDKVSLHVLVDMMLKQTDMPDDHRYRLMAYIVSRPKEEIFREALIVFESDSLPTCAAFCGILSRISDEKANFLDFDAWTKICQKQVINK